MTEPRSPAAALRRLAGRGFAATRAGYLLVFAGSGLGLVVAPLGSVLLAAGAGVLARQPGSPRYRLLLRMTAGVALVWVAFSWWAFAVGEHDPLLQQLRADGLELALSTVLRLVPPVLVALAAAEWFAAEGFEELSERWRFSTTLLSVLLAGALLALAGLLAVQATTPERFVDAFGPTGIAVVVVGVLLPYGYYLTTLFRTVGDLSLNLGEPLAQAPSGDPAP